MEQFIECHAHKNFSVFVAVRLVDEIERLARSPKLANPLEAKRCMGLTYKTDKLDAKGLAIQLRNGTLP